MSTQHSYWVSIIIYRKIYQNIFLFKLQRKQSDVGNILLLCMIDICPNIMVHFVKRCSVTMDNNNYGIHKDSVVGTYPKS